MFPGLNATFISLAPKDDQPSSPDKYRPIALCNIIYKIVSKVIASRLKLILPLIISPEQSGYVEGPQIMDGIILTHEIIHSLKKSKKPGATINKSKSHIFFFHTPIITQATIARILGFSIAILLFEYLGAHLTTSALKHSSWKILLEKLEARLSPWTHRALNMSSRLVLITTILHSMPLYLFSTLAAPKCVLKEIKHLQRSFFWGSTSHKHKWDLVKWDTVCLPKSGSGTGLRDASYSNEVMAAHIS
eukprot:PITA_19886